MKNTSQDLSDYQRKSLPISLKSIIIITHNDNNTYLILIYNHLCVYVNEKRNYFFSIF